ncbi:MAG: hypothetical protein QME62_13845, partial [Armatimonadota bacterium]|nr:hypothetical protein [Armatimonadota bacterium]
MEQTRIIPPGGDEGPDARTRALSAEEGKTAMVGAYRALEIECFPGNRYALSTEPSREHLLIQLKSA